MTLEIRLLGTGDGDLLQRAAAGVFDGQVQPGLTRDFLADARHHIVVAIEDGVIVGMVTAVDYVHPDKARQLWINEVGVAPSHQKRGIGRKMLDAMLAHGRVLGCTEAWLGTEADNSAARRLYERAGGASEEFILYSFSLQPGDPVEPSAG